MRWQAHWVLYCMSSLHAMLPAEELTSGAALAIVCLCATANRAPGASCCQNTFIASQSPYVALVVMV
jgi:hypothetical protein